MDLHVCIQHIHPSARVGVDYELRDDSDDRGVYIARWDVTALGPKPTPEAMEAVLPQAERAKVIKPLLAELRERRDKLLNVMDGIQSDALAVGDTETASAIVVIKRGLKDIPNLPALQSAADAAEFKQVVKVAYATVAVGAPPAVVRALMGYE